MDDERRDDPPGGLSAGDPLWSGSSEGAVAPERPASPYGAGPVPPGAGGSGPVRPAPPAGPPAPAAAGRFRLAPWWKRAVALLIDGVVISVGALILIAVITAAVGGVGFIGGDETGIAAAILGLLFAILVVAVVALLYAPIYMNATNGRTLGKQALGIRVVRVGGERTEFGWSVLREVVVKQLLFAGVLGTATGGIAWLLDGLWPLWDDESRALHDMLVQSRVVEG